MLRLTCYVYIMNTSTSQGSQGNDKRQALEEKLKSHIQREFCLGEKVISLLKQKKQLETGLQEQLQAHKSLKKDIEAMAESKQSLEQKFLSAQKKIQTQQNALRKRSRRIVEREENSRETLDQLRQKIHMLKGQLETVDKQKVTEQTRLLREIQNLRQKEVDLSQQRQQISHQRDSVEKQLGNTTENFQKLLREHQDQKRHYERQMKSLVNKQLKLESMIELVVGEQNINEDRLRQEIQSLEISKAQLEKKLTDLEQKNVQSSWDLDANLLRVIEKQERFIRELKGKAHKRSAILRSENKELKETIEEMSSSQEKARWENQMLESSLKGLQTDLAEYLQVKRKFEDAQREKEHVEEIFQRKLKFLESHTIEDDEQQEESKKKPSSLKKRSEKGRSKNDQITPSDEHARSYSPSKKSRLLNWMNMSSGIILNIASIVIVVGVSVAIYYLIPWEYVRPQASSLPKQLILERSEEIPDINGFEDGELFADIEDTEHKVISIPRIQEETSPLSEKNQPGKFSKKSQNSEEELLSKTAEWSETSKTPETAHHNSQRQAANITVQLSPDHVNRFSSKYPEPLPTIENNSILRRHYEQKLVAAHR